VEKLVVERGLNMKPTGHLQGHQTRLQVLWFHEENIPFYMLRRPSRRELQWRAEESRGNWGKGRSWNI